MSILKNVTNNLLAGAGDAVNGGCCRKKELARKRWGMLAKALLQPGMFFTASVVDMEYSIRRFSSFGLFKAEILKEPGQDLWLEYSCQIFDRTYKIHIRRVEQKFTPEELVGFNNTGNICIWPSEEVLAFYLLSNINWFEGKQVLEIGGGMTCLAGLFLAKYGKSCQVNVTDGNPKSVENVRRIIDKNALGPTRVTSFHFDWLHHRALSTTYDVLLSSDCLFFDDSRLPLVDAIWHLLRQDGMALVLAPNRGPTLNTFVGIARRKGFNCIVRRYYHETVWQKHLHFKNSNSGYDQDLHYPILLLLKKPDPEGSLSASASRLHAQILQNLQPHKITI